MTSRTCKEGGTGREGKLKERNKKQAEKEKDKEREEPSGELGYGKWIEEGECWGEAEMRLWLWQ